MAKVIPFREPPAVLEGEERELVMSLCRERFPPIAAAAIDAAREEMWTAVKKVPGGGKLAVEDWQELVAEALTNELDHRGLLTIEPEVQPRET